MREAGETGIHPDSPDDARSPDKRSSRDSEADSGSTLVWNVDKPPLWSRLAVESALVGPAWSFRSLARSEACSSRTMALALAAAQPQSQVPRTRSRRTLELAPRVVSRLDGSNAKTVVRIGPSHGLSYQPSWRARHAQWGHSHWRHHHGRGHRWHSHRRVPTCQEQSEARDRLKTAVIYITSRYHGQQNVACQCARMESHSLRCPTEYRPSRFITEVPNPGDSMYEHSMFTAHPSASKIRFLLTEPVGHTQTIQQNGLHLVYPLTALLKSSAALTCAANVVRALLTILPFSIRGKLLLFFREKYASNPSAAGDFVRRALYGRNGELLPVSWSLRFNARVIFPLIAALPFVIFTAIFLASLERAPITGRRRLILLSPEEEATLVKSVLSVGQVSPTDVDWALLLSKVLALPDEGISSTTGRRILLGGEVLDDRDWRVQWVKAALENLEIRVALLSAAQEQPNLSVLAPPPTTFPLAMRALPHQGQANTQGLNDVKYDLLVIDRDEANAFSFGFGPTDGDSLPSVRRGVVVVYSGFLNEILGMPPPSQMVQLQGESPLPNVGLFDVLETPPKPAANPNLYGPPVSPTPSQSASLSVLLSHELAHLYLSHTLETYANTSLLVPSMAKMFSDVFRTLIFPLTAIFGPFINDSIGRSMNEGASNGFGFVGHLLNSCESRKLETEADIVGLRLLANAGIDPRHALHFWTQRQAALAHDPRVQPHLLNGLRHYAATTGGEAPIADLCGFKRTHPVDEERLRRLRSELERWERRGSLAAAA